MNVGSILLCRVNTYINCSKKNRDIMYDLFFLEFLIFQALYWIPVRLILTSRNFKGVFFFILQIVKFNNLCNLLCYALPLCIYWTYCWYMETTQEIWSANVFKTLMNNPYSTRSRNVVQKTKICANNRLGWGLYYNSWTQRIILWECYYLLLYVIAFSVHNMERCYSFSSLPERCRPILPPPDHMHWKEHIPWEYTHLLFSVDSSAPNITVNI